MKTHTHSNRSFDFYFPDVDTLALVEESQDEVVVRATRNTFSERRKTFFIRELAAEGFISDSYEKFPGFGSSPRLNVRWQADISWLKSNKDHFARARRLLLRLFLSAALLWLALMAWAFLH
jgi:hypothetical protein